MLEDLKDVNQKILTLIDGVGEEITRYYRKYTQWWRVFGRAQMFRKFVKCVQIRVDLSAASKKLTREIDRLSQSLFLGF